ncbi:MAG: homocysteine S-methyltransferase family protein [Rhodocyclaceae bacterium]|nr:homocysteine S-methyltransferase family protein [Rhodocyclaceae bacterium]
MHADYLDAGADIIETNTFNATCSRRPTTVSKKLRSTN